MECLEPWIEVRREDRAELQTELYLEVGNDHPLYGIPVTALAKRQDRDDVLFSLKDGSDRVAVVHLTWTTPNHGSFPRVTFLQSLDQWSISVMGPDHAEFSA